MNRKVDPNSSKEAVLDAAAELFAARGYTAVRLKQLADKLGIKQASLYYHFPLGKEDLYVEVMLRHLEHRRATLEQLISQAEPNLKDCLLKVGGWLIQQPPLHADRMLVSDLPELSADKAAQLEEAIYRCAFAPLEGIFVQYRDQIKSQFQADLGFIAGSFLCYLESLYTFRRYGSKTEPELVSDLVDLLFEGSVVA